MRDPGDDVAQARSGAKSVYLAAAALAKLDVSPESPEEIAALVDQGFHQVEPNRRPDAVASLLRVIAAALESAQANGLGVLHESDVKFGRQKVCPVYPFGGRGDRQ